MKLTKILALLLALSVALCFFTACGDGEENGEGASAGGGSTSAEVSTPPPGLTVNPRLETAEYQKATKIIKTTYESDGAEHTATALFTYSVEDHILTLTMESSSIGRWENRIDENGNVTYAFFSNGNENQPPFEDTYDFQYAYDEDGNLLWETRNGPNDYDFCHTEYEYDENGNRTKITDYSSDGSISSIETYEYDGNGNLTKEVHDNRRIEYTYDGNGNCVSSREYDSDGNLTERSESMYDGSGNWVKTIRYFDDGEVYCTYECAYDENGRLTKKVYDEAFNDGTDYTKTYEYDENGNLTKEVECDHDGNIKYIYEYADYITVELTPEQADITLFF